MVALAALFYLIEYSILGVFAITAVAALIVAIVMTKKHHKVPAIILYIVAGLNAVIGIAFAIWVNLH